MSELYKTVSLSTVVKINSGIALPKIFKDIENTQGEYQFFKVAQMNNDKKIMKGAELKFTKAQSKEFKIKLFPKGSVLIPKRGGAILTNKKRLLTEEASYDSNIMGLKADNTVLTDEFLIVYMDFINLSDYIDTSTIPQINNKHIEMMKIPLPPLQEQKRIVVKLDALFEKIDKAIALHQKNMDEATAFMGSALNDVFGELEEKYPSDILGNLISVSSGNYFNKNEYTDSGVKIFKINNVTFGKTKWKNVDYLPIEYIDKFSNLVLKERDLLLALNRPLLDKKLKITFLSSSDIPSILYQRVGKIEPLNDNSLIKKYIFWYFNSPKFINIFESKLLGSDQPYINNKNLYTIPMILPPLKIQQKTVTYLDEISKKIEKIKQVQKEKMQSLVALKASILDKAFRGEL